jgi:uncharacterized protein YndB with AHSA1/START domain
MENKTMNDNSPITIKATVNAPVDKVWQIWSEPDHITKWASPSEDWHTTRAENDLREGGNFLSRMEAKDGSFGFDFGGTYDVVKPNELIEYTLGDGRKVKTVFNTKDNAVEIVQTFDPESENPREMQQAGWQAILDSFKRYTEAQ